MAAAANLTAALVAAEQALTVGHPTGGPRALAAVDWFALGLPNDGNSDENAAVIAREKKRVWIEFTNQTARGDTQETGNETAYDLRVEVRCSYYSGHPENRTQVRDCHLLAVNDFHKVRQALCWPGNLNMDATGNLTGLAGGALIGVDSTWQRISYNQEARSIRTLAVFRATIHVS